MTEHIENTVTISFNDESILQDMNADSRRQVLRDIYNDHFKGSRYYLGDEIVSHPNFSEDMECGVIIKEIDNVTGKSTYHHYFGTISFYVTEDEEGVIDFQGMTDVMDSHIRHPDETGNSFMFKGSSYWSTGIKHLLQISKLPELENIEIAYDCRGDEDYETGMPEFLRIGIIHRGVHTVVAKHNKTIDQEECVGLECKDYKHGSHTHDLSCTYNTEICEAMQGFMMRNNK